MVRFIVIVPLLVNGELLTVKNVAFVLNPTEVRTSPVKKLGSNKPLEFNKGILKDLCLETLVMT